jgi:hypothetical protein
MTIVPVGGIAVAPGPTAASAPAARFAQVLERARTPAVSPPGPPAVAALAGVERAQQQLDAVLAAARQGRTFTAAELLGLQAQAYRCAQTVDLASKLVEQGAQAVKQALNTQL